MLRCIDIFTRKWYLYKQLSAVAAAAKHNELSLVSVHDLCKRVVHTRRSIQVHIVYMAYLEPVWVVTKPIWN